jgi:hypothetical protein
MKREEQISDRGKRLFDYFSALVNLRTAHVLDCHSFEELLFLKDIPRKPGCHSMLWGESADSESENWIEIKKPKRKLPPKLPLELSIWIDQSVLGDSSGEPPSPLSKAAKDKPKKAAFGSRESLVTFLDWKDQQDLHAVFDEYISKQWVPWAQEDRLIADVQGVYSKLYSIHQQQQRLGEAYEVVLSFGLLQWKSASRVLKRHVLTTPCMVTFDLKQEIISVGSPGDGTKLELDTEWLQYEERPQDETEAAINLQAAVIGESLWDQIQIHQVLRSWVTSISATAQYEIGHDLGANILESPTCYFAPALVLRKRTQKSLITTFKAIAKGFQEGKGSSSTLLVALTGTNGAEEVIAENDGSSPPVAPRSIEAKEIYFPMPSNDQQDDIIRRLDGQAGVLVQGPPGTGKSHTIANLICHLLAEGKRVLITSHAPRALEVLKEKLPEDISPLCVCVLANDAKAIELLEESVQGITTKYNNWNPSTNLTEIKEAQSKLHETRIEISQCQSDVLSVKEKASYVHPPVREGYQGTEQEISQLLHLSREKHGWIDSLVKQLKSGIELTGENFNDYIEKTELLKSVSPRELNCTIPDLSSFVDSAEFADRVREEKLAQDALENHTGSFQPAVLSKLQNASLEDVRSLSNSLDGIQYSLGTINNHISGSWATSIALEILADKDRKWRHLAKSSRESLERAHEVVSSIGNAEVHGLSESGVPIETIRIHVVSLIAHLKQGKSLLIWPFSSSAVQEAKYIIKRIRIDGKLCNNAGSLEALLGFLDLTISLKRLDSEWTGTVEQLPSGTLAARLHEYEDLCEPLTLALELHDLREQARKSIKAIAGLPEPKWHDFESLRHYSNSIKRKFAGDSLSAIGKRFSEMEHSLRRSEGTNSHPAVATLASAIHERDPKLFAESYNEILRISELLNLKKQFSELDRKVQLFSPMLQKEIQSSSELEIWQERASKFDQTLDWLSVFMWLKKRSQAEYSRSLEKKIDKLKARERDLLARLAGLNAWKHCFARMSDTERQALIGWSQAIKKIGKGTGKRAVYARKAAQEYMEQCRSAIPAWIMPIYRIAESVSPVAESFDVVIIDEASQCGPEALFLAHLGKKIIVVGDDKQISPESVGVEVEQLEALKMRYLKDIPHAFHYGGAESSFFGLADILFKDRIRLREHFRCMPEIIQFSNLLSYSSEPLIPLKQFSGGRLTPTVSAKYVSGGYEKGEKARSNPVEADAILNFIENCIGDSKYKGKTFGIISMVGDSGGQINLINKMLNERISPKEMDDRKIICGNPYSFQGDERDVICLGLTVAPREGKSIYALTKETDKKRFNVAASRAKEQMILFHSVTENDLSQSDFRYQLLSYCQNPKLEPIGSTAEWLSAFDRNIKSASRARGNQPEPFDSWFEVDVFKRILAKGYRVIPQYEIAGKRIDMVIDGPKGRIAVECDGDEWHGPAHALADFNRQRMLERCKFTFWRILGSDFYLDPEESMNSLWLLLDDLGFSGARTPDAPVSHVSNSSETTIKEVLTPASQKDVGSTSGNIETSNPTDDLLKLDKSGFVQEAIDILGANGPMTGRCFYKLICDRRGIQRLGSRISDHLNSLASKAAKSGELTISDECNRREIMDRYFFIAGQLPTPREKGPRELEDIPPSEIGNLFRSFGAEPSASRESFFKRVTQHYGFERLRGTMYDHLERAWAVFPGSGPANQMALESAQAATASIAIPKPGADSNWVVSPALHKNLVNWNSTKKIMTNSREKFLLSKLESAVYFLGRGRSVEAELMKQARDAVFRAIELGFDPFKEYPENGT